MHHGPELTVVLVVTLTLVLGAFARGVSQRLNFPYTILMLLIGAVIGVGLRVSAVGGETLAQLHQHPISSDLVIFVFLPALVFESAFALEPHAFRKNLGAVLIYAGPALLVAAGLTAALVVGLTHGTWNWTWPAALVFGALISATDPVAVVAILREVGAPKRLSLLIEGESLLNDGTAIVLFTVLLSAWVSGEALDPAHALGHFAWVVLGGVGVGLALGSVVIAWLDRTFNDPLVEITLTVVTAYAAMIVAEALLHVSGVLAIVTAGILVAGPGRARISPSVAHFLHEFWEMLAYLANTLIFFLVGVLVAANVGVSSLETLWLSALVFVGVVAVRFVVVFAALPLANRTVARPVDARQATLIAWGGLRGAVSLALALLVSQRSDVDPLVGQQILQVTVLVVLGTIVVNGSTTGWLLRRLGLAQEGPAETVAALSAEVSALASVQERAVEAAQRGGLRGLPWPSALAALQTRRLAADTDLRRAHEVLARSGAREIAENAWRAALAIERSTYRREFASGTLGAEALTWLEHELDVHGDLVEAGDFQRVPRLDARPSMRLIDRVLRNLGVPFGRYAFRRMRVRYDIARVCVTAATATERWLAEREGEFPPDVQASLLAAYREYHAEARAALEDLRVNLPEVTEAIERRLLERVMLGFEQQAYAGLDRDGRLAESLALATSKDVQKRLLRLYFQDATVPLRETAELCRSAPLFREVDDDTMRRLAEITVEQVVDPGEWLFHQGDPGDSMFVVARGAVEVLDEGGDEPQRIATLGGGDVLGEMSLLSGEPRNAGARALTLVTVGRVTRSDFERSMEERPAMRDVIWTAYTQHARANATRAEERSS
ncbi:MAG: cation:proton antiporter [Polyangiales bacterium]